MTGGTVCCSVVDPNTLHLDPDPEFWHNLNPDPGYVINFEKKKIITNAYREKPFSLSKIFVLNYTV